MFEIHPALEPLAFPVEELHLLDGNPRKGDVDAVARSYETFGQRKPIVARREGDRNVVIAGNHQLQAAKRLGWERIAVVFVDDDDEMAAAFALADNRTADLGSYDEEALLEFLNRISNPELLAATAYSASDIDDLLGRVNPIRPVDPDEIPDAPPAKSVRGDLWILGRHRLLCGDSTSPTDLERLAGGAVADMVWMDPPYNVAVEGQAGKILNDDMDTAEFGTFMDAVMTSAFAGLRKGGSIYVAHAESERLNFTRSFFDAGFKLSGCIIWRKHAMTLSRSDYQWQHEPILYGWKPGASHRWYGGRKQTSIAEAVGSRFQQLEDGSWTVVANDRILHISGTDVMVQEYEASVAEIDRPTSSKLHPTTKPVALVERHIRNSSRVDDIVLDLFGGSGTTLIAAERTGRVAHLMELDPKFVDVICRRFQEQTGMMPVNEATGREHDFSVGDDGAHRPAA